MSRSARIGNNVADNLAVTSLADHNQVGRRRRAWQRRRGIPMAVFCARNCDTVVSRYVEGVGCGAGRIVCLECAGTGWWDYMEPEIPGYPCVDCKGTGFVLVSIA